MIQNTKETIDYLLALKNLGLHPTKLAILDDMLEDYILNESEINTMTDVTYYSKLLKGHLYHLERSDKPQELEAEIIAEILSTARLLITAIETERGI